MRILLLLLISITFSFSANLLYLEQEKNKGVQTYCIDNDYYYDRNRMYFYDLKADRERSINTAVYQKILVVGGWELDQYYNCVFDESKYFGLTYEQYNLAMAFFGVVCSFLIGLAFIIAVI